MNGLCQDAAAQSSGALLSSTTGAEEGHVGLSLAIKCKVNEWPHGTKPHDPPVATVENKKELGYGWVSCKLVIQTAAVPSYTVIYRHFGLEVFTQSFWLRPSSSTQEGTNRAQL